MTGDSPITTVASMRTTSKALTANSSDAISREKARRSPNGSVAMEWVIAVNREATRRALRARRLGRGDPRTVALTHRSAIRRRASRWIRTSKHGRLASDVAVGGLAVAEWFVSVSRDEAVGRDGEKYAWTWLSRGRVRDGRFESSCVFDPEDEEAAFAYAEERVAPRPAGSGRQPSQRQLR